jgi:nucleoside-diphosphate-sugar epimerase
MRMLLTGATGFVGRHILRSLADAEASLVIVVRNGKEGLIPNQPNVEKIICTPDLFRENDDWWSRQCEGVDIVLHAAWYAEPGKYLMAPENMDCLLGSLNLARGAVGAGIKRFVGIGTCFEYDLSNRALTVEALINPRTPYASAKASLYFGLRKWLPVHAVSFAWCRLFYLYGEGEDKRRFVPYLCTQLEKGEPAELTSGNQVRDFMDVVSAGRLIAKVALGDQQGPINICSGVPITVRQLAEKIADRYGRRDLLRFGSRPDNLDDPPHVVGVPNHGIKAMSAPAS